MPSVSTKWTGQLQLEASNVLDLDAPYLDANGVGSSQAATPYAVTVEGGRLLVAAAGSDNLLLADLEGNVTDVVGTGFGPKGVVAHGDTAWVYNANGFSISRVDLDLVASVETAGL